MQPLTVGVSFSRMLHVPVIGGADGPYTLIIWPDAQVVVGTSIEHRLNHQAFHRSRAVGDLELVEETRRELVPELRGNGKGFTFMIKTRFAGVFGSRNAKMSVMSPCDWHPPLANPGGQKPTVCSMDKKPSLPLTRA